MKCTTKVSANFDFKKRCLLCSKQGTSPHLLASPFRGTPLPPPLGRCLSWMVPYMSDKDKFWLYFRRTVNLQSKKKVIRMNNTGRFETLIIMPTSGAKNRKKGHVKSKF